LQAHAGNSDSGSADIRIGFSLSPKGTFRAVARDENGGIAHRPEALGNAIDQVLVVALGEIRASDAACKQNVTHECASYVW
jgi:hypothetical protein